MSLPGIEGVNPGHAAAGFGGALASLPFMPPGSKWTILVSLASGVVTAMYMTPWVAEMLATPSMMNSKMSDKAELGMAFVLGLTAFVFLPLLINMVRWCAGNLDALMTRITGVQKPKEGP